MQEYEVSSGMSRIDFGATGVEEVLQNVSTILTTFVFTCPMNRDLGWDPDVDAPLNIAKAKQTSRIVSAIQNNEPRAQVASVTFSEDGLNGTLIPLVRVMVDGA